MAEIGTTYRAPKGLRFHNEREAAEHSRRPRAGDIILVVREREVARTRREDIPPTPLRALADLGVAKVTLEPVDEKRTRPYDADGNPLCVICGEKAAEKRSTPGRYPERCKACRRAA